MAGTMIFSILPPRTTTRISRWSKTSAPSTTRHSTWRRARSRLSSGRRGVRVVSLEKGSDEHYPCNARISGGGFHVCFLHVDEDEATLVEALLHTGRTHQIRVHFQFISHPLVGDNAQRRVEARIKELSEKYRSIAQFIE